MPGTKHTCIIEAINIKDTAKCTYCMYTGLHTGGFPVYRSVYFIQEKFFNATRMHYYYESLNDSLNGQGQLLQEDHQSCLRNAYM